MWLIKDSPKRKDKTSGLESEKSDWTEGLAAKDPRSQESRCRLVTTQQVNAAGPSLLICLSHRQWSYGESPNYRQRFPIVCCLSLQHRCHLPRSAALISLALQGDFNFVNDCTSWCTTFMNQLWVWPSWFVNCVPLLVQLQLSKLLQCVLQCEFLRICNWSVLFSDYLLTMGPDNIINLP